MLMGEAELELVWSWLIPYIGVEGTDGHWIGGRLDFDMQQH